MIILFVSNNNITQTWSAMWHQLSIVLEKVGKSQLQSHTDKRSFIVYLWTVCTFIISNKDDSSTAIKPLRVVLFGKQMRMNK